MYGNNPLPQTGIALGPLALLFNGAALAAYVVLGVLLIAGGYILMRRRTHQRGEG